ncbi:MAG: hypothetical protein PHV37_09000 [Candidatus Gastranaerophilales bacterium]|nr:hypothetical protein [Candidatus Gastranaerophilales bacterium]
MIKKIRDLVVAMVAIRGGNSNNGAICGVSCSNLNNAASNANWNIGSSIS